MTGQPGAGGRDVTGRRNGGGDGTGRRNGGGDGTGRRAGRRGGDSGTREAILAAARARFGEVGYDRATIRGIAAEAGVDPALVHHFFGTKERLFVQAMRMPLVPGELVAAAFSPALTGAGAAPGLGEHVLRTVLDVWDVAAMRNSFLGLLRTAVTSEQGATMMREFATDSILSHVADVAGRAAGDGEYRAALVASQVLGLALARYVLQLPPLAGATNAELAAAIGPTLDRYLTADVHPGVDPDPGGKPSIEAAR